ncbi:MAG: GNAT family N-acetyltransferase [Bacteroidia bacterium]|nr:GNAT family N-acetyltransferase [Bacteroidia bacterium]
MVSSFEKFQIKPLGKEDVASAQKLIRLFQEVFEEEASLPPSETYLAHLLGRPDFVVYGAFLDQEIVGGLTAYTLPMFQAEECELLLYDIAVSPPYQRQGLGKKLLAALNTYCHQQGIKEMFVAASEEDTHALDFYHACQGQAEKVVHFSFFIDD